MKIEIKNLVEKILQHKHLYYSGKPIISDDEYDRLEAQLKEVDPENPVLEIVGDPYFYSTDKLSHNQPMLSLDKKYDVKDLLAWSESYETIAMYKIDGVSCSLVYNDSGVLALAKTRGNGFEGENITPKMIYLDDIPKRVSLFKQSFEVRGELFLTKENFEELKSEMMKRGLEIPSSKRNIVSGLISRKIDFELCRYLSFKAFDLLMDQDFKSEKEKLDILDEMSFKTLEHQLCISESDVTNFIEATKKFTNDGNFQIDGAVFILNSIDEQKKRGFTAHHPKFKMAFKFQGESAYTHIQSIAWQVSRNGVLTPVANVEETYLSEAKISRVTLHNYGTVKSNQIKIGTQIEIVRSGEVIPKFLKVISRVNEKSSHLVIPESCPSCSSTLKEEDIRLICPNIECPERNLELINYFIKVVNIKGLSRKRIQLMMNMNLLKDPADLYSLSFDKLMSLPNFKETLSNSIIEEINKAKNLPLYVFIESLGPRGFSANKIKKLINHGVDSLDKFMNLKAEDILDAEGVSDKSARDFIDSLNEKKNLAQKLLDSGLNIVSKEIKEDKVSGPFENKKICITGELSKPRKELAGFLESLGAEIQSSVSKTTDFLICNDKSSTSSKMKKAKTLNTMILTEEELKEYLLKFE